MVQRRWISEKITEILSEQKNKAEVKVVAEEDICISKRKKKACKVELSKNDLETEILATKEDDSLLIFSKYMPLKDFNDVPAEYQIVIEGKMIEPVAIAHSGEKYFGDKKTNIGEIILSDAKDIIYVYDQYIRAILYSFNNKEWIRSVSLRNDTYGWEYEGTIGKFLPVSKEFGY